MSGFTHLFIDGDWVETAKYRDVIEKYTGVPFATVAQAGTKEVQWAIETAAAAFGRDELTPYRRYEILLGTAERLAAMRDEAALTLAKEAGKALKDAQVEVDRACQTLRISAEEAKRIHGEMIPVDAAPGSENRLAFTLRQPRGVVAAITPFNFPLNLVCHKIGPALAAGNTVVLKPASNTPLSAALLCRLLAESGLPRGHINLVIGSGRRVGEALLADERIAFYSFTGSVEVGKRIRQRVGLRPATLELGGNGATIICDDADIDLAIEKCVRGAFTNAGQVCVAVQRILIDRNVWDEFVPRFVAKTQELVVGDPTDPETDVGPLIDEREAKRVASWVNEAVAAGGEILTGGDRWEARFDPTVLVGVPKDRKLVCEEAFGPVVTLHPVDSFEEALADANETRYGLQGGVFTASLERAMAAAKQMQVGGVMVNDTSAYRADVMPYGGIKESGLGREGPRYAIEEMTELKTVVLNLQGSEAPSRDKND